MSQQMTNGGLCPIISYGSIVKFEFCMSILDFIRNYLCSVCVLQKPGNLKIWL